MIYVGMNPFITLIIPFYCNNSYIFICIIAIFINFSDVTEQS